MQDVISTMDSQMQENTHMHKIWKIDELSLLGSLSSLESEIWQKLETNPDSDDPTDVDRFIERLIYRETDSIPQDQPCVYFFLLGDNSYSEIVKVGKSTAYQVYHRRINAQTYFFEDVICLGIQFCDSKKDALALEKAILGYFSPDTQNIRKNCELVGDNDYALRPYITICCSQPQEFLEAAEIEWKQRRKRKTNEQTLFQQ